MTGKDQNIIHSQKLLHPLGQQKLMSKVYCTDSKRLIVTHKQPPPPFHIPSTSPEPIIAKEPFNAVNQKFWEGSSSDSDSEDDAQAAPGAAPPMVRDRGDDVPDPALQESDVEEESDHSEESDVDVGGESGDEEDHFGGDERRQSDASHSTSPEERSDGAASTDWMAA